MRNIVIAAALAGSLAACAGTTTEEIGTLIDSEKSLTPPGANSFRVVFDPVNPGVPAAAYVTSAKDEDNVRLRIAYPDGTEWLYTAEVSKGSTQTAAIAAAQEAVARIQGQTVADLAPSVTETIRAAVLAALGNVPQP